MFERTYGVAFLEAVDFPEIISPNATELGVDLLRLIRAAHIYWEVQTPCHELS